MTFLTIEKSSFYKSIRFYYESMNNSLYALKNIRSDHEHQNRCFVGVHRKIGIVHRLIIPKIDAMNTVSISAINIESDVHRIHTFSPTLYIYVFLFHILLFFTLKMNLFFPLCIV